jgi:hypothetical protein
MCVFNKQHSRHLQQVSEVLDVILHDPVENHHGEDARLLTSLMLFEWLLPM